RRYHMSVTRFILFFFYCYLVHPTLHSFPTRRSSDLPGLRLQGPRLPVAVSLHRRRPGRRSAPHHAPALRRASQRAQRRDGPAVRSEEHTSELQSRRDIVCRLLLEKKKLRRCLLALVS